MSTLIFLEDPGAVSFIKDVFGSLENSGIPFKVLATGPASKILKENNIKFEEIFIRMNLKNFLKQNRIKLLLTGTSQNPNSLGLSLIDCAKELKINTAAFVDTSADYQFRFKGKSTNPLNHVPDNLLVPDIETKKIYARLGMEEKNIVITGSPNYQEILNIRAQLDEEGQKLIKKRVFNQDIQGVSIVFIDEHSNKGDKRLFLSEEYNFNGRKGMTNRNEIIASEVLDVMSGLNIKNYFIVRLHPKSDQNDYLSLGSEIDEFNSSSNYYELIYGADLIVGMTSALLMESFLLGKEVISIIPRDSEIEWLPPGLKENVKCVYSAEDLTLSIKEALNNNSMKRIPDTYKEINANQKIKEFIMKEIVNYD